MSIASILVTGGVGYLGNHLVSQLRNSGVEVVVLDNLRYGQSIPLWMNRDSGVEVVVGDVRNVDDTLALAKQCEVVVPLAGLVGMPACAAAPEEAEDIFVTSFARFMKELPSRVKVLYPATNSGYGTTPPGVLATESSTLRPLSLYAQCKTEAEAIVVNRENGRSLRLATLFGVSERMRDDLLVHTFVKACVSSHELVVYEPKARRNFIHVQDAAEAFVFALERWHAWEGDVMNLGNDSANVTKRDLADLVARSVGDVRIDIDSERHVDPDRRDYNVSNSRLYRFGFRPKRGLEDGVEELMQYYRSRVSDDRRFHDDRVG